MGLLRSILETAKAKPQRIDLEREEERGEDREGLEIVVGIVDRVLGILV